MKKIILILSLILSFNVPAFATEYSFVIQNAAQPLLATSGTGVLAENIVYDSVTVKYWWVFTDSSGNGTGNTVIRIASATTVDGIWTIQTGNLIAVAGQDLIAPHIVKFGDTWYIYFGNQTTKDLYVYSCSTPNGTYADANGGTAIILNGGSSEWDENRVTEPDIYFDGTTYHMLYMGESVSGTLEKIGYASGSSPIGPFTKSGSNPVLAGSTSWFDLGSDRAADPIIFVKDSIIYVGVAATNSGKNNWHNIFFKTTDFITYTPINNKLVLTWSYQRSSDWDVTSTHRGHFFQDNDGVWWAPYTGKNSTTYKGGIGRLYLIPKRSA